MNNAKRTRRLIRLFRKQKGKCYLCGQPMALAKGRSDTATTDHLIPKCRVVPDYEHTVKAACFKCNQTKGSQTVEEFRAVLEGVKEKT